MTARRLRRRLPLFLLLLGLLTGCGGGGGAESDDFAPRYEPPADAVPGGTLRVLVSGDIDSLDPGATIAQLGGAVATATQRTLLMAAPEPGGGLVPDLAAGPPRIDQRARTVEFDVRPGIRYSPPVDRAVKAGDFKYAIERALLPGVANGYVDAYLGDLEGFDAARRDARRDPTTAPNIAGISTPDNHTLRLRFARRVPPLAAAVFSLPLGAPVPAGYARRFDAEIPSTYDQHLVASGPYMIPNDSSGRLTGYRPGIETTLERNPNWSPATDRRPAFVDRILIENGYSNVGAASRRILEGESMVSGDFAPDPSLLSYAANEHPDHLMMAPASAAFYASLNTTIAPLDNVDLRRAIVASTDREAIRRVRGGTIIGPLATHFIPPGVPGFEEAGGLDGPGFDFLDHPQGDLRLARRYMRRAGYPDGRYDGDQNLLLVTDTSGVGRRVGELVKQALESLGIPVRSRSFALDVMYSRYCNVPRAEVAICPNVGWLTLMDDPQTTLFDAFSGDAIRQINNSNWSQLAVPAIDRQMRRARWIADPDRRARAWGRIDREVMRQAPAIPQVWTRSPMISSSDVRLVIDRSTVSPSFTMTSLSGGEE